MVLDVPRCAEELYFARAAEDATGWVSVLRPVMTGDVFAGIDIPGVDSMPGDDDQLAMVVGHPCTIRNGSELKPKVQMIRVVRRGPISLAAWERHHYDLLPLPDLTALPDDAPSEDEQLARVDDGAHVALFEERGSVPSASLDLRRRIACLSEAGVAHLHQRMGHADNRHAPSIDDLMTACDPVFTEIELWETWNKELINPALFDDPEKLQAELSRVGKLFDDALSEKRILPGKKDGRYVLRDDLARQKTRAETRRKIHKLLNDLQQAQAQAG